MFAVGTNMNMLEKLSCSEVTLHIRNTDVALNVAVY